MNTIDMKCSNFENNYDSDDDFNIYSDDENTQSDDKILRKIQEDIMYIPKVGKCGFANIGNTCYMNSILQLLFHCKPFISFILKDENNYANCDKYLSNGGVERIKSQKFKKDPKKFLNKDNIPVYENEIKQFVEESFTHSLSNMFNKLVTTGTGIISPNDFKMQVGIKIPDFRGYNQQDSHELLLKILDNIIEETGISATIKINNVPTILKEYCLILDKLKLEYDNDTDIQNKLNIINKINEHKLNNKLLINNYNGLVYISNVNKKYYNPFIFQLRIYFIQTICCLECSSTSSTFSHNTILTLEIKKSINESLNTYVKDEEINDYMCGVCNKKQKANKQIKIYKLPMVLFIHLNRFKQTNRIEKNRTDVEIPHEIDLADYCDQSMNTEKNISTKFKLRGISNHIGSSMGGGHYTSDCVCIVDDKSWYHFDDRRVQKYNGSSIDTSSAYILMYDMEFPNISK